MKPIMKNRISLFFVWIPLLFCAACQRSSEEGGGQAGEGCLALGVKVAAEKQQIVRSASAVETEPYVVRIFNARDELIRRYEDHAQLPSRIWLMAGDYTVTATSGKVVDAAFDAPVYAGEAAFAIERGKQSSVTVETLLGNAKAGVEFEQNVLDNFPQRSVAVSNGLKELTFTGEDEARMGYFRVGEGVSALTWSLNFVNREGRIYLAEGSVPAPKANTYYRIRFKMEDDGGVDGHGGIRILAVVVEETVVEVDHHESVVIPHYPTAQPFVNGERVPASDVQNLLFGDLATTYVIEVSAASSLTALTVSHNIAELTALGIPAAFDFLELTAVELQKLEAAGLRCTKAGDGRSVTFDLSDFVHTLPVNESVDPHTFTFYIADDMDREITRDVRFTIFNSDVLMQYPRAADIWATRATVRGKWLGDEKPAEVYFEYRAEDETDWSNTRGSGALSVEEGAKTFSEEIAGLRPGTKYYFRAVGSGPSDVVSAVTESDEQLPNMNFDSWNGNNPWPSGGTEYWGNGNNTFASMTKPTSDVPAEVGKGQAAVLKSQYAGLGGSLGAFAAGNLFTGNFIGIDGMGGKMNFGRPYTCRPLRMTGYYKYQNGAIDYDKKGGLSGKQDRFHIYVMLTTWGGAHYLNTNESGTLFDMEAIRNGRDPEVIAFAELTNQAYDGNGNDVTPAVNMPNYERFDLPLTYFRKDVKPTYILVVATSSMYGDSFTGSTSSTLWVDEFALEFE